MENLKEFNKSVLAILRETSRSYKFSAFSWFTFSFVVYYTVLKISGYSAAAGYVENSVRPFLNDTVAALHDITVDSDYPDEIYSIRYLTALKKWNHEYLDELEKRFTVAVSEENKLELQDEMQSYKNANIEINSRIDELIKIKEKINKDGAILVGNLEPNYFLLAYIPDLIDRHFNEKKASEFSVERKDGFLTGGMIINKVFVTHWLWYAPFIISLTYVFLDVIQMKKSEDEPVSLG